VAYAGVTLPAPQPRSSGNDYVDEVTARHAAARILHAQRLEQCRAVRAAIVRAKRGTAQPGDEELLQARARARARGRSTDARKNRSMVSRPKMPDFLRRADRLC
jgi:hypothetical protein